MFLVKQCMSSGLKTIQLNARSHARRQRHESRVSQRTSTTSQQQQTYPYLNTTDHGMMDMINHHHHHHHNQGGAGTVGNTLLAPVGFAPISPLDEEHPGTAAQHHRSSNPAYIHDPRGGHGGWLSGQQHGHPQGYGQDENSSSRTPTADMATPTTTTSSGADQAQSYHQYHQNQHHPPQCASYGPGPPPPLPPLPPPPPSYPDQNITFNTAYHIAGPSQRR